MKYFISFVIFMMIFTSFGLTDIDLSNRDGFIDSVSMIMENGFDNMVTMCIDIFEGNADTNVYYNNVMAYVDDPGKVFDIFDSVIDLDFSGLE